jgi:tetratricopeptide (TPR) repeat protein
MLARDGQLAEAVALYERALDFGLESGMVPDREARMVWASAMHNEARQLAREGDVSAATLVFARAKEINPDSTIDGPAEARKLGAEHFAERGRRLTDPIEAAAAFQTAFELDPETRVWPFTLNQICWEGVQMDAARNVLWICEKAVAAEPDNGGYRDSRGVARALTGDTEAAIEDFTAFISWGQENFRDPEAIDTRRRWIAALGAGRRPTAFGELKDMGRLPANP